jgi:hypothetical protein
MLAVHILALAVFPLHHISTSLGAAVATKLQQSMEDVYAAFSEHLRRAQAGEVSVLDEEDGLLVRWSAICEDR